MYVLYEEAGKFLAGRVMSEADSSLQVELDSGKRVKVKSANALLKFAQPDPAQLIAQAQAESVGIELEMAWEFAPDEEFGFADLSREYFSANATTIQQAATLFRLFEAPHYFRRLGRGMFRKASEETVKAALIGIERKKQIVAQIDAWADELVAGRCPEPVREQLYKLLFRPDKNSPEYKAVVEAADRAHKAPLDLLKNSGAIDSPYQFHWRRFLFEQFPKGTGFPALTAHPIKEALPRATVEAFSIDDSTTTEIDDALSVSGLGTGTVVFGIHIAAPALAFMPDSPIDKLARERLSTVYMPGYKLTMLPDSVVSEYTLQAGRDCPAVSLYVTFDEATLETSSRETKLELVPIAANLRHDQLDGIVTEASLTGVDPVTGEPASTASTDYAFHAELAFGFRLAKHLKAGREVVRGKPENFNRPDYNFKLVPHTPAESNGATGDSLGDVPDGTERVVISTRQRGAPLDLIVAEAMILANSTWGGWIDECGVPGIYRSQASMAPGVKVRMGTKAAPHAGMGVAQYTWATSPLRRYVDLVNQWQIIACARHGRAAALAAPFKPRDAQLFSIISAFDAAYAAYNAFQSGIERFWTLRYIRQNDITELDATVMKDGLVRADELPLVFKASGADSLGRGVRVRVRVTGTDELTLDVHASVIHKIVTDAAVQAAAESTDKEAEHNAEDDSDDTDAAGPLTIAMDVSPEDTPGAGTSGAAAEDQPATEASPGI